MDKIKKQAEKIRNQYEERILTKKKKQKKQKKKKKRRIMIQQVKVTKIKNQNQKRKQKKDVTISVFYSNDDATAFTADMVKIKELTPKNVLNALADKGVIDKDIKINKFEVSEIDGMQSINIDFDQFKEYIMSCGSTQEYYVVGGICNTFIKAYRADRIKITVDGNCLETGHNDYPDYMFEF